MKLQLSHALQAWNTENFSSALKSELEKLGSGNLPLDKATTHGGMVDESEIAFTILTMHDTGESIIVEVGIFFTEIIGGCSCGDDPFTENAYCRARITIDKYSAETDFCILDE